MPTADIGTAIPYCFHASSSLVVNKFTHIFDYVIATATKYTLQLLGPQASFWAIKC